MKKFDLHVHTKATVLDEKFEFDIDVLESYVTKLKIDCIAITNHNLFDQSQFEEIAARLPIKVFPGIEVSLEQGHIILIAPDDELTNFSLQCGLVSEKIKSQYDHITLAEFQEIFPQLNRYLVIPHYRKNPILNSRIIGLLIKDIVCGEVSSIKDFTRMINVNDELAPLYFSDIRIKAGLTDFPAKCTYLAIDEINIPAIKTVLCDKTKISLSEDSANDLADILSNGLKISTKLTIVLGERSTGKTYTLNAIAKQCETPKYIKQFELLSKNEEKENEQFQENIRDSKADFIKCYLKPFQDVVDDIIPISLEDNEQQLQTYIDVLLKIGEETYKEDAFSKTKLFREEPFSVSTFTELDELIKILVKLLENSKYDEIIYMHIEKASLIKLLFALIQEFSKEYENQLKKIYVNDTIRLIQHELKHNTTAQTIPECNFYQYLLEKRKISIFNKIACDVKREKEIHRAEIGKYKVIINALPFDGAKQLKSICGKKEISFSEAFAEYKNPYRYLKKLTNMALAPTDLYRYFVDFRCKVLNQYGLEASGGERSEFNLSKHLEDATQHDMLIIDEPESSFDNPFLKTYINETLKQISQIIPVIIATHNSTIGASIKPDYIIYTKNEIDANGSLSHKIYSGYPTNKQLVELGGDRIKNQTVQFECLEAGQPAYYERKNIYENFEN